MKEEEEFLPVRPYFRKKEWDEMGNYEKRHFCRMLENHNQLVTLGLTTNPFELQFRSRGCNKRQKKNGNEDESSEEESSDETWTPGGNTYKEKLKCPLWYTAGRKIRIKPVVAKQQEQASTLEAEATKTGKSSSKSQGSKKDQIAMSISSKKPAAATGSNRYPKRNIAPKNYEEFHQEIKNDELLYCDKCEEAHIGECDIHGPPKFIKDSPVPEKELLKANHSIPEGLRIAKSSVKGAGSGVFSDTTFFKKGLVFGPYLGKVVKKEDESSADGYCWEIKQKGKCLHYVSGKDISNSNWMRYVNCPPTKEEENLEAFQYKGQIFYRILRTICPSDELFVWYGDKYGAELAKEREAKEQLKESNKFTCKVCAAVFNDEGTILAHLKWHRDSTGTKRHACKQCSYSADQMGHYKKHVFTHTGERPFECQQCLKRFTQLQHLARHRLTHSGERPFQCKSCDRRFNCQSNLREHLLTHTGAKPHKCPQCDKNFAQKKDVNRHLRIHATEKRFHCNRCNYECNRNSQLNDHVITNHSKRYPHSCIVCGKGFVTKYTMRKHLGNKHRQEL